MGEKAERDAKPRASTLGFEDTAMEVASESDDVGLDDTALVLASQAIAAEPPDPAKPSAPPARHAGVHPAVGGRSSGGDTT